MASLTGGRSFLLLLLTILVILGVVLSFHQQQEEQTKSRQLLQEEEGANTRALAPAADAADGAVPLPADAPDAAADGAGAVAQAAADVAAVPDPKPKPKEDENEEDETPIAMGQPKVVDRDMFCDADELDNRIDANGLKPICIPYWGPFYDRVTSVVIGSHTVKELGQMLDHVCANPCGPSFQETVKEYRDWCNTSPEAEWFEMRKSLGVYRVEGFIAVFGCAKDGRDGKYCLERILPALAKPLNEGGREAKCQYYTSCCFGEMLKTVRYVDQAKIIQDIDAKCPGAAAAAEMSCE